MALVVTHLEVRDFRNYKRFSLQPDPELTVFLGPNAVGKTSLIEAVQLLTEADSFRKPSWQEVIRIGADSAYVRLVAEGDGRRLEVELDVASNGRRVYRVNGKQRRKLSEVTGLLPCVVFTPDDLRIVKDSAERRRSALDSVGSQLSPTYLQVRQEYEKTLRQRNSLLKQQPFDEEYFGTLTDHLINTGSRLFTHRKRLFGRILEHLRPTYSSLAVKELVDAVYVASWERDGANPSSNDPSEAMRAELQRRRAEENARGTTLVGPHRDEVLFTVGGRDARAFASQGQQRTIALAWKLSEVMVITEVSDQPPVLLLDDVMSELDESRRHALTAFVGSTAQTFVTTTNIGYFEPDLIERAKVISLS